LGQNELRLIMRQRLLSLQLTPSKLPKFQHGSVLIAVCNLQKFRPLCSGHVAVRRCELLHVYGELFNAMAGVNLVQVPYRGGGPALIDLLGGQVDVMFESVLTIACIRAGKLRALAVTSATRSAALPDIPTVGEFVPGYEASSFYGVGVPKSTPAEIIDKLNRAINAGLADPKIKARRSGRRTNADDARRVRQGHYQRHREVGQGDPGGQH
jgi:hypothetical protein